jgi:hypothetical protein
MIDLYSPQNEAELALLKSILEGEGIYYFVRNDNFGSLEVGPRIGLFNTKMIQVQDDHSEVQDALTQTVSSAVHYEKSRVEEDQRSKEER